MKRSVRVFAALALVTLFVVSAALFRRAPDPAFEGRLTSEWTHDLLSSDYTIRNEAQTALKILGEPAVPQLRNLLRRRNGPWEKPLARIAPLLPFYEFRPIDANLARTRASEMLATLGPKSKSAAPDLVAALAYEQSAHESERALLHIGEAALPHLERGLSSSQISVRVRSARLLRECALPSAASSIGALLKVIDDKSPRVRAEAALSLGKIFGATHRGPQRALNPIDALLNLARDSDPYVRAATFESFSYLRDAATPEILAGLTEGLRDSDRSAVLQAAKSFWSVTHDPAPLIPVLTSLLATPECWRAAYLLGEIGSRAAPAIPALARLLSEERVPRPFRTPPSSAFALGRIGVASLPELLVLLENPEVRIRMNALMALGFMGANGKEAIPQLLKHLHDPDSEVRHTTALTLASLGAEADQIISPLSDCLRAEDIYMRSAAAAVLRKIAPEGEWYVQAE
jgi:HEAT repeat protein